MKVLFICDEYPPGNNGGIGTTVQNLGRELVRQGHEVFVAGLYAYRYGQKNMEIDQGVKVWRLRYSIPLPVPSRSKLYTVLERLPHVLQRNLNGKRAFAKFLHFLETLIDSEKIDVIEIADFNNFAMYIGFPIRWPLFKAPLVLKSHGSYTYFCKEMGETPRPMFEQNDQALFKRAEALSSVSHYTANLNKKLFHLSSEVKVLYNGVSYSPLQQGTRDLETVVFTGTLVRKKGIYALMKAWNQVAEIKPGARLLVYGKGNPAKLKRLLQPHALESVQFMGHVSRNQLFEQLRKATLAVFPSYSETFGMGVVEAMNLGCPVIYTKRSCGPEIVKDGIEGLLVDPDNTKELSEKILFLLNQPEQRATLADNALLAVKERFNIVHSTQEHVEFYNEVVKMFKQKRN